MDFIKKALVITTIASSKHPILQKFAKISLKQNIDFIIIGDKKSPSKFTLKGANYFSLKKQTNLSAVMSHAFNLNTARVFSSSKPSKVLKRRRMSLFIMYKPRSRSRSEYNIASYSKR